MKEIITASGHTTQVDDDVYDWLNPIKWCVSTKLSNGKMYVSGGQKMFGRNVLIHRVILHAIGDRAKDVDHIDGNPLNNQRSNLRLCTRAENLHNTHKRKGTKYPYKGVIYDKSKNRYRAILSLSGKKYMSKRLKTVEEAALAWNELASIHHGKYAVYNVIQTPPPSTF